MSICVSRASRVSLLWPRTAIPRESIQCRQRSRATQAVDPHCGQTDQSFCIWMQKGILFNGILQNERGTIDRISLAIAPQISSPSQYLYGNCWAKLRKIWRSWQPKGLQSTLAAGTEATPDMKHCQSIAASI